MLGLVHLGCASPLALVMCHMTISRSSSREFGATSGTGGFGCRAGFLSLVSKEVAEGGKLPAVTPVVPALWFGSLVEHSYALFAGCWCPGGRGRIGEAVAGRRIRLVWLNAVTAHVRTAAVVACSGGIVSTFFHPDRIPLCHKTIAMAHPGAATGFSVHEL